MSANDPHWAQVAQLQAIKTILEQQQKAIENLTETNRLILLRQEVLMGKIQYLEENAHA